MLFASIRSGIPSALKRCQRYHRITPGAKTALVLGGKYRTDSQLWIVGGQVIHQKLPGYRCHIPHNYQKMRLLAVSPDARSGTLGNCVFQFLAEANTVLPVSRNIAILPVITPCMG